MRELAACDSHRRRDGRSVAGGRITPSHPPALRQGSNRLGPLPSVGDNRGCVIRRNIAYVESRVHAILRVTRRRILTTVI